MDLKQRFPLEVPVDGRDYRGEHPAITTPAAIHTELHAAAARGETHYVPVSGIPALREAVAKFLSGLAIDRGPQDILVTCGEQEARYLSLGINPGTEGDLAVPDVAHPGVAAAVEARSAQAVTLHCERKQRYLPPLRAIEAALEAGCHTVYLESPSRLTGFAYSEREVEQLAELLEAHQATAIWDQTLAPVYASDYRSLAEFAPARTLAIGALWPGLGLESWRLGYVAAGPDQHDRLVREKQILSICTAAPVQWAGASAASVFEDEHPALLEQIEDLREEALGPRSQDPNLLASPTATLLTYRVADAAQMCEDLARNSNFLIMDGSKFGAPDLVRLTVKPNSKTLEVLELLRIGVSQ